MGFFWPSQGNMEQGAGETGAWRPWELAGSQLWGMGSAGQSSERGGDGGEDDEEPCREWGGENVQGCPGLG